MNPIIERYNMLNTVKPKKHQTAYPYSLLTNDRIELTQKKISIVVKTPSVLIDQDKNATKHGGYQSTHLSDEHATIFIYG